MQWTLATGGLDRFEVEGEGKGDENKNTTKIKTIINNQRTRSVRASKKMYLPSAGELAFSGRNKESVERFAERFAFPRQVARACLVTSHAILPRSSPNTQSTYRMASQIAGLSHGCRAGNRPAANTHRKGNGKKKRKKNE